jgi:hypothetical protein
VHVNILAPLSRSYKAVSRQLWSSAPTSVNPAAQKAWEHRLFRYFSTPQPYTSPLTLTGGNLTGETWELRESYREWGLKEPACKAALASKCLAVCQLDPQLIPNDPKDAKDREAAAWVRNAIAGSAEGWAGLLWNMLFPALLDGFSVIEPVWGHMSDRDNRYPNWWTTKSFTSVDTNYTRFRLDTFRQVTAVQSIAGNQGAVQLNPKDFLIFTHFKLFENPFGVSDVRAAVRGCQLLEAAIRLRHILLTNFSGPFIKATAKDNAARAKLMNLMNKARANGWIVVPEGSELDVINLATSAVDQFQRACDDYRADIVRAIQGAYLQLLEGGDGNQIGRTETHRGIAELFVWWLAVWASQVISHQLIPQLVEPQFGRSVGYPRLSLGGIDEAAVSKALDRFAKGLSIGLDNISKTQAMVIGGFESAADDADRLKLPQPAGGGQGDATGKVGGEDPFGSIFSEHVHVNTPAKGGPDRSGGTFRGSDQSAALAELLG